MKRRWVLLLTITVLLVFSGAANATLTTIGTATYFGSDYKLIYEDDQELVWLDWTKGHRPWQEQHDWASGLGGSLTVILDPDYTTSIDWSTGWRLPSTDENQANPTGGDGYKGPDGSGYHTYWIGYNMVNSEMGHLFYESLGNLGYKATDGTEPQPGWGLQKTMEFDNLSADPGYWSGTYSPDTDNAWNFYFKFGHQIWGDKDGHSQALAVRPGQVTAVPEPTTMILLGSGLVGLAGARRKKFKK